MQTEAEGPGVTAAAKGAANAVGGAVKGAAKAVGDALLPKWLIKGPDGKAKLNPEAESVQLTNGLMCNMIKKMKDAKQRGADNYENIAKYAKEALDEHPMFK